MGELETILAAEIYQIRATLRNLRMAEKGYSA